MTNHIHRPARSLSLPDPVFRSPARGPAWSCVVPVIASAQGICHAAAQLVIRKPSSACRGLSTDPSSKINILRAGHQRRTRRIEVESRSTD